MIKRLVWLLNLAAVGAQEGCAVRHQPVQQSVDVTELEDLIRSKVEIDVVVFTAKRGRPPSSIEEVYPDQEPPIRFWGLPYVWKLEGGEVIAER